MNEAISQDIRKGMVFFLKKTTNFCTATIFDIHLIKKRTKRGEGWKHLRSVAQLLGGRPRGSGQRKTACPSRKEGPVAALAPKPVGNQQTEAERAAGRGKRGRGLQTITSHEYVCHYWEQGQKIKLLRCNNPTERPVSERLVDLFATRKSGVLTVKIRRF